MSPSSNFQSDPRVDYVIRREFDALREQHLELRVLLIGTKDQPGGKFKVLEDELHAVPLAVQREIDRAQRMSRSAFYRDVAKLASGVIAFVAATAAAWIAIHPR